MSQPQAENRNEPVISDPGFYGSGRLNLEPSAPPETPEIHPEAPPPSYEVAVGINDVQVNQLEDAEVREARLKAEEEAKASRERQLRIEEQARASRERVLQLEADARASRERQYKLEEEARVNQRRQQSDISCFLCCFPNYGYSPFDACCEALLELLCCGACGDDSQTRHRHHSRPSGDTCGADNGNARVDTTPGDCGFLCCLGDCCCDDGCCDGCCDDGCCDGCCDDGCGDGCCDDGCGDCDNCCDP